jgi:hypothetical protein
MPPTTSNLRLRFSRATENAEPVTGYRSSRKERVPDYPPARRQQVYPGGLAKKPPGRVTSSQTLVACATSGRSFQTANIPGPGLAGSRSPPGPGLSSQDQRKNGGWKTFTDPAFENQGDCVSFVATGGKNPPNG